jgi:hypothetical protein
MTKNVGSEAGQWVRLLVGMWLRDLAKFRRPPESLLKVMARDVRSVRSTMGVHDPDA